MSLKLPNNTIHIWLTYPDKIEDPVLLSSYQQLLNDQEKAQWQRFHFAKDQHQYLVTRALIRSTLSYYIEQDDPKAWRFATNAYGKPEASVRIQDEPVQFNLSHTDGLILCAVTLTYSVGIDVEHTKKQHDILGLAEYCLAQQERDALFNSAKNQQAERFLQYWTLKEAYIKAQGMGLYQPLHQFSFTIAANQAIRIHFDPCLSDNPAAWQFWQFKPSQNHIAALALKAENRQEFEVVVREVIPLQQEQSRFVQCAGLVAHGA